jgi:uncharacterized repeat protein (TIGR02543 family)
MKRIFSFLLAAVLMFGLVTVGTVPAKAASDFVISDECVQMIKDLEGFDKYPRWDYSQWTVGHGTRCPDEDLERYRKNGITYAEADTLLRKYAATFGKSVNSFIDKHGLNYDQNEFDALLLFTYNFGPAWMLREGSFRSGLLQGVTGNKFLYEIGQWCHVTGGKILTNLIKRRLMEANMFLNGKYSRTVPDNYCYVIYNFEGGDGETDVQCYDSNNPVSPYVIPTRSGYTFAGWYTAKSGGTKVTQLNSSVRNMHLYARWVEGENAEVKDETPDNTVDESTKIDPVKVTVNANGVNIRKGPGTNYPVAGVVNKGKTMTITETKVATGYTWGKFDGGWIALCFTNYESVKDQNREEETTKPTEPEETKPAPEENKGQTGTVTGNYVNVRKGPGTNYQVVGQRNKGDKVTILETKKVGSVNWGRMDAGWICMSYVKLDPQTTTPAPEETKPTEPEETKPTEPEETKPTEPEQTKPTEPAPEENKGQSGTVTGNYVNVRKGPGTSYKVVGQRNKGDRVVILETKKVGSTSWGRMDAGWICMGYVKLDPQTTTPAPEETKPTEPEETKPTEPEQTKPAPEETTPTTQTGKVKVNDYLRVRKGPGTNYAVVAYLTNGTRVTILETKGTWARIDKGWVSLNYIVLDSKDTAEKEEPTTWVGTVTADCLHIRSGAGTNYKIVGRLYEGDKVTILETKGTWGRISTGWISLSYVKK